MKTIKENNDYIYLSIMTTFSILLLGVFFHDPLLHSLIAYINGWEIGDYTTALMTGQTTAIATVSQVTQASTISFWLYYMFPAIFIYITALAAIILRPDRLIIITGRILIAINLASFNPQINGSDAYNAIQFLITRNYTETSAYFIHFVIMAFAILIWGIYEYIGTEDNPSDARKRIKNVVD